MQMRRYESDGEVDLQKMKESLQFSFSKRVMKNRLFKASMGETLASWGGPDNDTSGIPTREIIELYRRWGEQEDGFGLILTGNIQISLTVPHLQGDLIIDASHPFDGPRFEAWKQLSSVAKLKGSLLIGQLSYAGRQALAAVARKTVVAPSVVPFPSDALNTTFAKTREATLEDIEFLTKGFVHGAKYLEAAGFDGVELQGAHGYLLAQFLSPRTNKRKDSYGGSLTNRMRLLVEIATLIRTHTSSSFIIGVKLNSVEFQDGGFGAEEAAEVCRVLQGVGVDFVELSGGTLEKIGHEWPKESTQRREAFFLKFAQTIVPQMGKTAQHRDTKVFITGGLRTSSGITKALETVDAVGLARPSAQEPWIARDILNGSVAGSIRPQPPFDNDSVLSNGMTGSQLRQVAYGFLPFDSSNESMIDSYMGDMAAHKAAAANDEDRKLPWFADVSGTKVPYKTPGMLGED